LPPAARERRPLICRISSHGFSFCLTRPGVLRLLTAIVRPVIPSFEHGPDPDASPCRGILSLRLRYVPYDADDDAVGGDAERRADLAARRSAGREQPAGQWAAGGVEDAGRRAEGADYAPADGPGSPGGVVHVESSSPHFSSDGNRCWLVRDGQVVASFDYVSGVAILGPAGQPDWAKVEP